MPRSKPQYCPCGCRCTPNNYARVFFERWPEGWPGHEQLYKCMGAKCRGKRYMRAQITIDHIVPRHAEAAGKATARRVHCILNLQPMCRSCNSSKGNVYGFRQKLRRTLPNGLRKAVERLDDAFAMFRL